MRYKRHDKVRLARGPQPRQQPHLRRVAAPDYQLHGRDQCTGTECPSFPEHFVVNILQPDASELAEYIDRIQYLLQVDQPDVQGIFWLSATFLSAVAMERCAPPASKYTRSTRFISDRENVKRFLEKLLELSSERLDSRQGRR